MKTLLISILLSTLSLLNWAQGSQSIFVDNGYRPDSVVISGQILNRTTEILPSINYTHFITDESIKTSIPLDEKGNFKVKVSIFNSSQLYINYLAKGSTISLIVEPGESIFIRSDWKNDKVTFEGKRAKDHQQVFDYDMYLENINQRHVNLYAKDNISNEQYFLTLKQLAHRSDSLFRNYQKRHQEMTVKARKEIEIRNLNVLAFHLMQRRFHLDRMNGEKFSKEYMDYADSIFAVLPQPYTVVSRIFIGDYLNYYSEIQHKVPLFRKAIIDYAIQNNRIKPSKEQQDDITLILKAKEFQPQLQEAFNELRLTEKYAKMMLDYYNGGALIRPMPVKLKELVTTQSFYRYLSDNRAALSPNNLNYYKQQVKSPELRTFVLDYQQKLANLESNKLEHEESLKDITPFRNCETGEEVFALLTAPHKGKIIYLDIWGTWCAPCKIEMKYTHLIKKAMQGKDILFMYLANGSPVNSWKNVIKENQLTGEQIVHYNLPVVQQSLLEKYLNIHKYPTFITIDREGKIIKEKELRPRDGQKLIDHLNELLTK